jgi:hypothetical protein
MLFRVSYRDGSVGYVGADDWLEAVTHALAEGPLLEVLRLVSDSDDDAMGRALANVSRPA